MSHLPATPIHFTGHLRDWSLGEPPRIEIVSRPTAADNGVARSLSLLLQKILRVTVYAAPTDPTADAESDEALCSFQATLPPIMTNVSRCGKSTLVKLDVSALERKTLIRLTAAEDQLLRFEIQEDGAQAVKPKREKKPETAKGEHRAFWHYVMSKGFAARLDIRDWLWAETATDAAKALHARFSPDDPQRSLSFVSAETLKAVLKEQQLINALLFVEQCERELSRQRAAVEVTQ